MIREILASVVQGVAFLLGLALSLVLGMVLAAHVDGPGGLLFATLVAGAGLLGSAVLSQVIHDRLSDGEASAPPQRG